MRCVVGFLCTFSALISTGYSLSCIECMVIGSKVCEGPSIACSSNQTCGMQYSVISASGQQDKETYIRNCFAKNLCGLEATNTFGKDMTALMGISCCFTNNCLPPKPKLPTLNTQRNGLTCDTCIGARPDPCTADDMVQCTGDEDMCFLSFSKAAGSLPIDSSLRGCTTSSMCEIGDQSITVQGITLNTKTTCHSGSSGLYKGFFPTLLVVLVVSKTLS